MGRSRKKGPLEAFARGVGMDIRSSLKPMLNHPATKLGLLALAMFVGPEVAAPMVAARKQLTGNKRVAKLKVARGVPVEAGVTYFPPASR